MAKRLWPTSAKESGAPPGPRSFHPTTQERLYVLEVLLQGGRWAEAYQALLTIGVDEGEQYFHPENDLPARQAEFNAEVRRIIVTAHPKARERLYQKNWSVRDKASVEDSRTWEVRYAWFLHGWLLSRG